MLQELHLPGGFVALQSPLLTRLGIRHAFSTRIGPGGADLSLSSDQPAHHAAWMRALGMADLRLCDVHQVHGTALCHADALPLGAERPHADALTSRDPTRAILVRTADCVPILLGSTDGRQVAAIHAGWRGLAAGIIAQTIARIGLSQGSFVASIGPCIGLAAFEVDEDVAQVFTAQGLPADFHSWSKPHLDLATIAAHQLQAAGAAEVENSHLCTYADARRFFSFRRDRTHRKLAVSGHQAALIAATGA